MRPLTQRLTPVARQTPKPQVVLLLSNAFIARPITIVIAPIAGGVIRLWIGGSAVIDYGAGNTGSGTVRHTDTHATGRRLGGIVLVDATIAIIIDTIAASVVRCVPPDSYL